MSLRTTAAIGLCLFATHALASDGTVVSRHPDGRPSAIEALDKTVRFGAQAGATCDDAIVLADAKDQASRIRSQHVWLDAVHPGWTQVQHRILWTTPPAVEHAYSSFNLKNAAGEPFDVCFDVSDPMVAEAKALAAQPVPEHPLATGEAVPRQAVRCAWFFHLASTRIAEGDGPKPPYAELGEFMAAVAKMRGGNEQQWQAWFEEAQLDTRAGDVPKLMAEMKGCELFASAQYQLLKAEGKIQDKE